MRVSDSNIPASLKIAFGHQDHARIARRCEAQREKRVSARAQELIDGGLPEWLAYATAYRECGERGTGAKAP